ncbi:MAG: hypothetical protein ABJM06_07840 [Gilvibacter sp.]
MRLIHPHTALLSQQNALLPPENLIDGRTPQDHLNFMVGFAGLINFYDKQNVLNGNWAPFLLKDPAILLAVISATNFENRHRLFVKTLHKISSIFSVIKMQKENDFESESTLEADLTIAVTGLFDQLMSIFLDLNTWAIYLDRSQNEFELKTYVFEKLKSHTGATCYALVTLRQVLVNEQNFKGLEPYLPGTIKKLEAKYWTSTTSQQPFWKVLDFDKEIQEKLDKDYNETIKSITLEEAVPAIESAGDSVFIKLKKIIEAARKEYDIESVKKSKYPDTTLIRTFTQLLLNQQDKINDLTEKHLEYYYKDILKQVNTAATADSVFANISLADDAPYLVKLEPNTLFSAGQDENDVPIEFALEALSYLNTASISKTITLFKETANDALSRLFLNQIEAPAEVTTNEEDIVETWSTFGADNATKGVQQSMSIIYGSPILYLTSGTRTIDVTMNHAVSIDFSAQFEKAKYYLSTAEEWLQVQLDKGYPKVDSTDNPQSITFRFVLSPDVPEIVRFSEEAEQIHSSWPLIKFEFDQFLDLKTPPIVQSISFTAKVEGFKNLLLYNDNGNLGEEVPFQLYGPIANQGSNFMVGSTEIFSKQLEWLRLGYDWDSLPEKFDDYYKQYNCYLGDNADCLVPKSDGMITTLVNKIKNLNKRNESDSGRELGIPFNNLYFKVDFANLNANSWSSVPFVKEYYDSESNSYQPYEPDTSCKLTSTTQETETDEDINLLQLFSTQGDQCLTTNNSIFTYKKPSDSEDKERIIANPELQSKPLELNTSTLSGFVKMTLNSPKDPEQPNSPFGFGNDIYAQVVSYVTLYNAKALNPLDEKDTSPLPNPPFIPSVADFNVAYESYSTYCFDGTSDDTNYPIEVYYQTPFETYMVYKLGDDIPEYAPDLAIANDTTKDQINGLALYPSFNVAAALYLGFEKLMAPAPLDLYFEMITSEFSSNAVSNRSPVINYNALSDKGWVQEKILKDSTRSLMCSGLLSLDVPKAMLAKHHSMPDKLSWLSLSITTDACTMANTAYLNTNGVKLTRTGNSWTQSTNTPEILANVITGPVNEIQSYDSILQPFDSFGGRAATDQTQLNDLVSLRIRSKDRLVNSADYYDNITSYFKQIYYVKPKRDQQSGITKLRVVRGVSGITVPGAFSPSVDPCLLASVQDFAIEKSGPFAQIESTNFDLEYIRLRVTVTVTNNYEFAAIAQTISRKLRLYLSPWIKNQQNQVTIDSGLSGALISDFVLNVAGVKGVSKIEYATNRDGDQFDTATTTYKELTAMIYATEGFLFVSSGSHLIINSDTDE